MFDGLTPMALSIYILSLLMSFSIGANDAANALATSYGSNALKLIPLCLCGAVFEFIGACWGSQKVAKNLAYDMIDDLNVQTPAYQTRLMLAVSLASFFFIMCSSIFGMPISGTHTVISALVGAGIVGCGFSSIAWMQVVKIISSWVISPLLSSAMCLLLIMICCGFTMGGKELSLRYRLTSLSLLTGFSFALTSYMVITLFQVTADINPLEYLAIPAAFLLGVVVSRAILLNLLVREKTFCNFLCNVLAVWNFSLFEKILAEEQQHTRENYQSILHT